MIKVSGLVKVSASFEVELDMTEDEFDALSDRQQEELLEGVIDWRDTLESSETDSIDVWELEEIGADGDANET
jgi:hypothetical protein